MPFLLRLAVILGMVLSGPAHIACACGCGHDQLGQSEPAQEAACPRCCHQASQPKPGDSRPCQCRTCKQIEGVVPGPEAPVGSILVSFHLDIAPPLVAVLPVPAVAPKEGPLNGPPHSRALPVCALPVLLGHLLF